MTTSCRDLTAALGLRLPRHLLPSQVARLQGEAAPFSKSALDGDAPLIDVCEATWWAGVKSGQFPQPVRIPGTRVTAWIGADLIAFVDSLRREEGV